MTTCKILYAPIDGPPGGVMTISNGNVTFKDLMFSFEVNQDDASNQFGVREKN